MNLIREDPMFKQFKRIQNLKIYNNDSFQDTTELIKKAGISEVEEFEIQKCSLKKFEGIINPNDIKF